MKPENLEGRGEAVGWTCSRWGRADGSGRQVANAPRRSRGRPERPRCWRSWRVNRFGLWKSRAGWVRQMRD